MLWTIVSAILILVGIFGTVAPFLPGPPLVLGGLLVYGLATHFAGFSGWTIGIFVALTVVSFFVDLFLPALGARGKRVSHYTVMSAFLGTALGVLVLGPIGIIAGPILGAFLAEYLATWNVDAAMQVARKVLIAFVIGTALKLGIVFAMAGYFIYLLAS